MSNISISEDIDYGLRYVLLFRLIVWGYIGLALSLFGIFGNIITILVLMSSSLRRISTNIYFIALSCSNILFLLIFIPSYSVRYLLGYNVYISNQPPFAFEILLARLPTTPIYNTILLSIIYLTIAVSMDRLISIKFPLQAKRILTKRVTLMTISFIYIFSIVYCIPYWLEQHYIPELQHCRFTNIGKKIHKYIRIYIYIPVVYVIPFLTLTCINITIIINLIRNKRQKQTLRGKTKKKKAADYHITLMLVAIVIVFVLCQLPLLVLNAWYAIDPHGSYSSLQFHTLNSIGVLLIAFNTSTNFMLYCFFGQQFRSTLVGFVVNIFSRNSTNLTLQKNSLNNTKCSLQLQQRPASEYCLSMTNNDRRTLLTQNKELNQPKPDVLSSMLCNSLTTAYKEEFCPLLKTNTVHHMEKNSTKNIPSVEEKSQSDGNDEQIIE